MMNRTETIAAIATALSPAGIGIIRISGDDALTVADRVFCSAGGRKRLADQKGYTVHYGHITEDGEVIEAINPEIVKTSGKVREVEGCLSVPNRWGYVTRPKAVVLRAYNRRGEQYELKLKDLGARCACHESDHLDGHLFLEKVEEFCKPEQE